MNKYIQLKELKNYPKSILLQQSSYCERAPLRFTFIVANLRLNYRRMPHAGKLSPLFVHIMIRMSPTTVHVLIRERPRPLRHEITQIRWGSLTSRVGNKLYSLHWLILWRRTSTNWNIRRWRRHRNCWGLARARVVFNQRKIQGSALGRSFFNRRWSTLLPLNFIPLPVALPEPFSIWVFIDLQLCHVAILKQ